MYIWNIDVEVRWSFHDKDESGDEENFVIAAESFEKAMVKVRKIALAKNRKFTDVLDGEKFTHWPVSVDDVIKAERGDYIDG